MKVRITRATSENWYHVGEEYDICENTLHRNGQDYHPLVSDRKVGIGVGHFEVVEDKSTFPFKVKCIYSDESYDRLKEGEIYIVECEYAHGDWVLDGVIGTWDKGRFEIVKEEDVREEQPTRNKYMREIKKGVWVDCYDVLRAFNVTDPCLQHLLKKALAGGQRGHKDLREDLQDILASAKRAVEMYDDWHKMDLDFKPIS